MKNTIKILPVLLFWACSNASDRPDATGIFEANEVIVSAEAAGVLDRFAVTEGQALDAGQNVGAIDCTQLGLQLDQVQATERALDLRQTDAGPQQRVYEAQIPVQEGQIAAQRQQLEVLRVEQARISKLVTAKAAPSKQLDDINGQIEVLQKQIAANEAQINVLRQQSRSQADAATVANRGVLSEKQPLSARKAQLNDQIERCKIINPIKGTVLTKYVEQHEMASMGKALYKIANLDKLTLRAYMTGDQLPAIKIGQAVQVQVAQGDAAPKTYAGTVTWIADKAEFTPKTIQTRDERANLVYAVRIEVPNDGFLKIGMYADVQIQKQ
jgi:HlyD family secretion protein